MTEYNDSGGCVPEFKEKAIHDERKDWSAISDRTLERFTVTFSFTDLDGYRFCLPAYMIYNVRNHEISESIITESTIDALDIDGHLFKDTPFVEFFTPNQLEAICSFLDWEARNEEETDYASINLHKIREAQRGSGCNSG